MPRFHLADSSLYHVDSDRKRNYRGLNVATLSELMSVTGTTKNNNLITSRVQQPWFILSPEDREEIMQNCAYVQAVISSRMNRISCLDWDVVPKEQLEDEYYYRLIHLKEVFDESDDLTNMNNIFLRNRIRNILKAEFPTLKDDLSNISSVMRRWKKNVKLKDARKTEEIKDWIENPNLSDDFDDFVKKFVNSLMIHGSVSVYKETRNNYIDNLYVLPGGTVYPLRSDHVGGYMGYAQVVDGYIPKIYFQDEMFFSNYMPSAVRSYGYVPLDALINKISEQLLFDQFAAVRADGTKEPEKLIIFGDQSTPFGGDLTGDVSLPMEEAEQQRVKEELSVIRKGAIAMLTGVGHPMVHDISKADTFAAQSDRQDKLLRDIALVFNMTNMEVNLAGGQFTSGKETSESQSEIEEGKGTRPIIRKLENFYNRAVLPYKFGTHYVFKYNKGLTEEEQVRLDTAKKQSGTYTNNEIREARGDDAIMGEGNDELEKTSQQLGSLATPINMKAV